MIVITGGQSFADLAGMFTPSKDYATGIASANNMPINGITGKQFRIEIPDAWVDPSNKGKTVTMPKVDNTVNILLIGSALLAGYYAFMR